jgi:hypothetical protein
LNHDVVNWGASVDPTVIWTSRGADGENTPELPPTVLNRNSIVPPVVALKANCSKSVADTYGEAFTADCEAGGCRGAATKICD